MSRDTTDIANELLAENAALKAQIAALDERLIRYAGIATARAEHVAEQEKQIAALTAENVALMQRIDWPMEQCPTTGAVTAVAPEDFIPATDAAANALRAEGFERAIAELKDLAARSKKEAPKAAEQTHADALYLMTFANQLREGK